MLAAMFVVSVATSSAAVATTPSTGLPDCGREPRQQVHGVPDRLAEDARPWRPVTATPMKAMNGIVVSSPSACPTA